jgi:hypothetical protein
MPGQRGHPALCRGRPSRQGGRRKPGAGAICARQHGLGAAAQADHREPVSADLPKEGSHYDLPIALALLAAMGVTDAEQLDEFLVVGELSLDGRINPSPACCSPHCTPMALARG